MAKYNELKTAASSGKTALSLNHFAQRAVEGFNRIGGVDDFTNLGCYVMYRIGKIELALLNLT
jgi:hypothetical protein